MVRLAAAAGAGLASVKRTAETFIFLPALVYGLLVAVSAMGG